MKIKNEMIKKLKEPQLTYENLFKNNEHFGF